MHCLCTCVAAPSIPSISLLILRGCDVFGVFCWSLVGLHVFLEIIFEFSWWIIVCCWYVFYSLRFVFPDFLDFKGEKLK